MRKEFFFRKMNIKIELTFFSKYKLKFSLENKTQIGSVQCELFIYDICSL